MGIGSHCRRSARFALANDGGVNSSRSRFELQFNSDKTSFELNISGQVFEFSKE